MGILRTLYKAGTIGKKMVIFIICPYQAQRSLYIYQINSFQKELGFPKEMRPHVTTSKACQGQECYLSIYDVTRSEPNTQQNLGLVGDRHNNNVAESRATHGLITVGTTALEDCRGMETYDDNQIQRLREAPTGVKLYVARMSKLRENCTWNANADTTTIKDTPLRDPDW